MAAPPPADLPTPEELAAAAIAGSSDDLLLLRRIVRRAAGLHVPAGGNDAIGTIFRVGGVSALIAAYMCWQMRKKKRAAMAGLHA
jgi:hypothetical protein